MTEEEDQSYIVETTAELVPADLMTWAVTKPNIGHLNPPFLRAQDVRYYGADHLLFEMFMDVGSLNQNANFAIPLKRLLDPSLWSGVVPFKFVTRNSWVAMAHYEFARANIIRLDGIDIGDAKVRVVLTISSSAFTKALLQGIVDLDFTVDGVIFVGPMTTELHDGCTLLETQVTVNTLVANELPEVACVE
jgi:hypothetical protein